MTLEMKIDAGLIRQSREDKGWSQEHLAAVSGLSARTIQRLEAEGVGSKESQMALAAALGLDASALLLRPVVPAAPAGTLPPLPPPIAAGSASRLRLDILLPLLLVPALLAIAMFYQFGKDLAARDNAYCAQHSPQCPALRR